MHAGAGRESYTDSTRPVSDQLRLSPLIPMESDPSNHWTESRVRQKIILRVVMLWNIQQVAVCQYVVHSDDSFLNELSWALADGISGYLDTEFRNN
jgi:hypothetical protein